jgi:Zn-finger nucleic acid-binding protein
LTPRRTTTADPVEVLDCHRCRGVWLDGGVLARLRAELSRRRRERRPAPYSVPRASPSEVKPVEQVPYDVPAMNAAVLPAALLIALLVNLTPVVVLLYPFLLLVHELGHALVSLPT